MHRWARSAQPKQSAQAMPDRKQHKPSMLGLQRRRTGQPKARRATMLLASQKPQPSRSLPAR